MNPPLSSPTGGIKPWRKSRAEGRSRRHPANSCPQRDINNHRRWVITKSDNHWSFAGKRGSHHEEWWWKSRVLGVDCLMELKQCACGLRWSTRRKKSKARKRIMQTRNPCAKDKEPIEVTRKKLNVCPVSMPKMRMPENKMNKNNATRRSPGGHRTMTLGAKRKSLLRSSCTSTSISTWCSSPSMIWVSSFFTFFGGSSMIG